MTTMDPDSGSMVVRPWSWEAADDQVQICQRGTKCAHSDQNTLNFRNVCSWTSAQHSSEQNNSFLEKNAFRTYLKIYIAQIFGKKEKREMKTVGLLPRSGAVTSVEAVDAADALEVGRSLQYSINFLELSFSSFLLTFSCVAIFTQNATFVRARFYPISFLIAPHYSLVRSINFIQKECEMFEEQNTRSKS